MSTPTRTGLAPKPALPALPARSLRLETTSRGSHYRVLSVTNLLVPAPGSRLTRDEAQGLIDEGVKITILAARR